MRYFITGATGYIGSALVSELVRGRDEVNGLVRNHERAGLLERLGGRPVLGTIEEPRTYEDAAGDCDVLIHLATSYGPDRVEQDRTALSTLLRASQSAPRKRSVIYTSGVWVLPESPPAPADETSPTHAAEISEWRSGHEYLALNGASDFVATAVIRPGLVYGGKGGLLSAFFQSAIDEGAAAFVGDGNSRWSLVHREDLARLYRRVGEKRGRGIFHGVEDTPLRVEDSARACSEAAGAGATRSIALAEARREMGVLADALAGDRPASAPHSRALGWSPEWDFARDISETWNEWRAG
jgi:nucleoside-diphosphate-sugar epimerase